MDTQRLNEILGLPKDEKLKLMEVLWNNLNEGMKDTKIPEWHNEVLEERLKKIENGDMEFVSWQKVKEMLRERMK